MLLTFIIPVRHPDNAENWSVLCERLSQTVRSIAAQTHKEWQCVIVANDEAVLPDLPEQFVVKRVSFPPNPTYDLRKDNREAAYDAVRLDKGRRILAGMLAAPASEYFMIVDDDDFISARLVEYVANHRGEYGWKFHMGYIWGEGGRLLMGYDYFYHFCGTSMIIRSDLFDLPCRFEDCPEQFLKEMLGSHKRIVDILADRGTPLSRLPFRGAVYRIGHRGAHSKSAGVLKGHIFCFDTLRKPRKMARNLLHLGIVNDAVRKEFCLPV